MRRRGRRPAGIRAARCGARRAARLGLGQAPNFRPPSRGHFAPFPRIVSSASLMPVHGGEISAMSAVVWHGVMRSGNAPLPATRDLLIAGPWSYEPGFLGANTQKLRLSFGRSVGVTAVVAMVRYTASIKLSNRHLVGALPCWTVLELPSGHARRGMPYAQRRVGGWAHASHLVSVGATQVSMELKYSAEVAQSARLWPLRANVRVERERPGGGAS